MADEDLIRFRCCCGSDLKVRSALAGREFACPKCHTTVVVPSPAGPRQPSPLPTSAGGPPPVITHVVPTTKLPSRRNRWLLPIVVTAGALVCVIVSVAVVRMLSSGSLGGGPTHASMESHIDPKLLRELEAKFGPMPRASVSDGSLQCVKDFLNENVHDPNGLQFVKWSGIAAVDTAAALEKNPVDDPLMEGFGIKAPIQLPPALCLTGWGVRVQFRAKNRLGAFTLAEYVFLIRDGQVVKCIDMKPMDPNDMVHLLFPPGTFPGEGPLRRVWGGGRS